MSGDSQRVSHADHDTSSDTQHIRWYWATIAAIASGAMMATCYWPLNWHWLAWVAMVPFLVVLPRLNSDQAWSYGTLMAVTFYLPGLVWLFNLMSVPGLAAVLCLALWMGVGFRVARILMDRFGQAAMLWAVPLAFLGQEVLRSEGLPRLRFSFLAWGYSQSHNLWTSQLASLGGVYFISFILVAVSAAIAYSLTRRRAAAWVYAGAVVTGVVLLGFVAQPSAVSASDAGLVRVGAACVQNESFDYGENLALTQQAIASLDRPGIVVLPEHTITEKISNQHPFLRRLFETAATSGTYICVGAHAQPDLPGSCDFDNLAVLIAPEGGILATQAKAVPVPFMMDGNPARTQATAETSHGRVGMCVCYDALFTDIPRRLVNLGAELLIVPVMDVQTWPIQECWQHADMAPMRAIELRRWTIRAASSGVSQIIAPTGQVVAHRTREQGPGTIAADMAYHNPAPTTVFVAWGYRFAQVIAAMYLILIVTVTLWDWVRRAVLFGQRRQRRAISPTP